MQKTDKIYTFRLPVDLLDALREIAEQRDLRINQLMRRVLREFVEGAQKEVK